MDLQIIKKGETFDLDIVSKQEGPHTYYFGAGWDNPNGPVDLDIVCAMLVDGKIENQKEFVYFGNRSAPGVQLSEDNTTGEGEGDDEDIVIKTSELPEDVNSVVIGLAAYAGADLHSAPNTHFRVCDGSNDISPQIADIQMAAANPKDTVMVAFVLTKGDNGWSLDNKSQFHQLGQGSAAIKGFGALYS